jgi:hypothetical protein
LYEQFAPWRQLKEELNIASDEQLAAVLLNDYFSRRNRRPIPRYVDYNKLYVYRFPAYIKPPSANFFYQLELSFLCCRILEDQSKLYGIIMAYVPGC